MISNLSDKTSLGENKVLILYFLKRINNNVMQDTLFKLMSATNGINYFVFKDTLVDLVDSNLVSSCPHEDDVVFKLTTNGYDSYELTKGLLPGLLKLQADTVFANDYTSIENEFSVISEFTPTNENGYTVKCKIIENTETIFEISTFAGSQELAQSIVSNWNTNASSIYPKLLNLLKSDNS